MLLLFGALLYLLSVVSYWLQANHRRSGWLLTALASAGWLAYGCLLGQWTWIPFNIAFVVTAIYGWRRWRAPESQSS
jgi:uncharacterized membrane protein (DUF485 family)